MSLMESIVIGFLLYVLLKRVTLHLLLFIRLIVFFLSLLIFTEKD